MAKKKKPDATLTLKINSHTLTGHKTDGGWTFKCPSFPALAREHTGNPTTTAMVGEFCAKALEGCVTVTELAKGVAH